MSPPTFTIDTAIPSLYPLTLQKEILLADYYLPPEGLNNFFHLRMRPFVHLIMRSITHDFVHRKSIPSFPALEHQKLRVWIEFLMLHFVRRVNSQYWSRMLIRGTKLLQRVVVRTIKYRDDRAAAGDLAWGKMSLVIPGQALFMLKLAIFLCNFVGYTTGKRLRADLDFPILRPLIESCSHQLVASGCAEDYSGFETHGAAELEASLQTHSPLLIPDPSSLNSPSAFCSAQLPMGYTGALFLPFLWARLLRTLNYSRALLSPIDSAFLVGHGSPFSKADHPRQDVFDRDFVEVMGIQSYPVSSVVGSSLSPFSPGLEEGVNFRY